MLVSMCARRHGLTRSQLAPAIHRNEKTILPSASINHIGIGRIHGHLLAVHPVGIIGVLDHVSEVSICPRRTLVSAPIDLTQILHVQDVCITRSDPDLVDTLPRMPLSTLAAGMLKEVTSCCHSLPFHI